MREVNGTAKAIISEITGLDGESLHLITGTVDITIHVGRMPDASELSFYLGLSKKEMGRKFSQITTDISQSSNFQLWADRVTPVDNIQGIIYALSAQVLSSNFYGDEVIDTEMAFTKRLLRNLFDPTMITSAKLFHGYNIALEYVWFHARGGELDANSYVKLRYGRRADTCSCLIALSELTGEKRGYKQFMRWLAEKYDELVQSEGE